MKKNLLINILLTLVTIPAFAEEVAAEASTKGALGAGLAIAIAAFGGAIGQGLIGKSAMEGIARNPQAGEKMFTPMILGLVLIESLVIYAFVIAFMKY